MHNRKSLSGKEYVKAEIGSQACLFLTLKGTLVRSRLLLKERVKINLANLQLAFS